MRGASSTAAAASPCAVRRRVGRQKGSPSTRLGLACKRLGIVTNSERGAKLASLVVAGPASPATCAVLPQMHTRAASADAAYARPPSPRPCACSQLLACRGGRRRWRSCALPACPTPAPCRPCACGARESNSALLSFPSTLTTPREGPSWRKGRPTTRPSQVF